MGEAAVGWLVLGVALHLANQVLRGRGWWALVRSAAPSAPRRRDVIAAWVAGAGAGGLVSARGGDAVRVLLLRRRMPEQAAAAGAVQCAAAGGGAPLLAGTLVAEGAGECAVGALLLALALLFGVGPQLGLSTTTLMVAAVVLLLVVGAFALARRSRRLRAIAAGVGRGCAPLRSPGTYARTALPWQLASRACRLGALACFLTAFGLPATPLAVLLVAFAQGGSRVLPFAPASVGAGIALLAASFGPVTGSAVSVERLAAFYIGTSTLLTVVGTVLALAICLRDQNFANAGRSLVGAVAAGRRRLLARAATVPTP